MCITSANLIIYSMDGGGREEEETCGVCVCVCVCVCVGWTEDVLEIFCLALFFAGRVRAAYKSVLCVSEKYLALR